MVAMSIPMILLFLLLQGTNQDLLSHLSTEVYWKDKNVEISYESMVKELQPEKGKVDVSSVVKQLSSEDFQAREAASQKILAAGIEVLPDLHKALETSKDPEAISRLKKLTTILSKSAKAKDVRRLMAIRALGELKDPKAVALLKPILQSKKLFEAEYAKQAIALIEGTEYQLKPPTVEVLESDLNLLPKGLGLVGGITSRPGITSSENPLDAMLDSLPLQLLGQDKDSIRNEINSKLLEIVDRLGNVRIDAITIGLSEDIGNNSGFCCVAFRGVYDADAFRLWLKEQRVEPEKIIEGQKVLAVDHRGPRLMFPSNNRLILLAGAKPDSLPVAEVAKKLQSSENTNDSWKDIVQDQDITQPLWCKVRINDNYRKVPWFAPFDTLTLLGAPEEKGLKLTLLGRGKEAEKVVAIVTQMKASLDGGKAAVNKQAETMEALKPIASILNSVTLEAKDGEAKATATINELHSIFSFPYLFLLGRDEAVPQKAVQPQPKPAPPVVIPAE